MHFYLKMYIDNSKDNLLPLNYHYELASAIYKILSQNDNRYAEWLHNTGYISDNKRFKLFNFSDLYVPSYEIDGDRMRILSNHIGWEMSFLLNEGYINFIRGVFKGQYFRIADKKSGIDLRIDDIEILPEPEFKETMRFKTISPVCISSFEHGKTPKYLAPQDTLYEKAILDSLVSRYKAAYGKEYEGEKFCNFRLLNEPKSALQTIKAGMPQQTRIKGYRYDFEISIPLKLMHLLYDCGIGEKNSLGFGMVKIT